MPVEDTALAEAAIAPTHMAATAQKPAAVSAQAATPTPPPISGWKQAFLDTRAILVGYIPFGMTLGLLMVHAGFPWYVPVIMSMCVNAGASQLAALPLIVAGSPLWQIALTTFVVNARHIFYGISMLDKHPPLSFLAKNYVYLTMTDEAYAILSTRPYALSPGYTIGVSFFCHFYWIGCTLLGAVAGQFIDFNMAAMEFSSIALFWVLTVDRYRQTQARWPFVLALLVSAGAWVSAGRSFLLVALLACVALLCFKEPVCKRLSRSA